MSDNEQEPVQSVSSLRSRFEQLGTKKKKAPTPPPPLPSSSEPARLFSTNGDPFQEVPEVRERASLDIRRPTNLAGFTNGRSAAVAEKTTTTTTTTTSPPTRPPVPRQRPLSVGHFSPPRSLPTVRVESPKSPPKLNFNNVDTYRNAGPLSPRDMTKPPSRPTSPSRFHKQGGPPPIPPHRPLKKVSPQITGEDRGYSRSTPGTPVVPEPPRRREPSPRSRMETAPVAAKVEKPKPPPPKPSLPPKRPESSLSVNPAAATATAAKDGNSPFSTPPGSTSNSPEHPKDVRRSLYAAPPTPTTTIEFNAHNKLKPQDVPPKRSGERVKPPPPPPIPEHSKAPPPPPPPPPVPAHPPASRKNRTLEEPPAINGRKSLDGNAPSLPPRPATLEMPARTGSLRGRSHSPPKTANSVFSSSGAPQQFLPPPQRGMSFKSKSPQRDEPQRTLKAQSTGGARTAYSSYNDDSDEYDNVQDDGLSNYPDASQANRRRPFFSTGPREIQCKSEVKLFAVCGQYLCTGSGSTKVWDLRTSQMIMSMNHGEGTRITAIAFKPSPSVEDEGTRLWLGTSRGELIEVDIPTQRVVDTRGSAHTQKEIVKIHRQGYNMWTLDESGKLQVWAPNDPSGVPNLRNAPTTFRLANKHHFSMVVGTQLWICSGKNIYVYEPTTDSRIQFNVLGRPITANKPAGDITCGTILNSEPDKVYFGHSDGKVSIYSRSHYTCIDVVSLSLYKISALAGVGDYLWAGFKTGMMYVYDVSTRPWTVKKDWMAHDYPIIDVIADRTSIWKIDRLQVVSLGMDNVIRLWDGMLEEDWLESEMQKQDTEFCTFRELKALVCTWNAGASKPQDLAHSIDDSSFFEKLLTDAGTPDIIVFGFQELVDLEDKKITAMSLLKGKKKKKKGDAQYNKEHMSHQYRLWKEHLTRCIERYMPRETQYYLLHTADLVGLFTCIFIKVTERNSIRNVAASSVKRGLGGLHGNKGALITRFLIDDSSLCFVNCHLAAGQSHTSSRNNDVAGILESNSLPIETDSSARTDTFVGGGDGSMILDHEICILNGDLNYRIDMHRDSAIHRIRNGDLEPLLERDQLLCERKKNPGFRLRAFNESPIRFAPTYKYDVNSDEYDTSEKKRAPAWCDRVLYRGLGKIKQIEYKRHEVRVSDHRPVSALFLLRVKTVDPTRRQAVWKRCLKQYERVKRESVYDAKLDFLVNVCGYDVEQARATLGKRHKNERELTDAVKVLQEQAGY